MLPGAADAAVVFGIGGPVAIPVNPNGIYLNIVTNATSTTQPADWNTAPWINPFFGGVAIASSAHLRPVITGLDQVVNLPIGTMIGSTSNFATGESGSAAHVGTGPDHFALGTPGFMGFAFESGVGGPTLYGWLQITINNADPGKILGWAYEDTGTAIAAGVPEPSRGALCVLSVAALLLRRRRAVR
jgi:hypothetical protein